MHTAQLITTHEAARRLGVVPQTVRNLIRQGELEAVFIPNGYLGRYLVDPADVDAFKTRHAAGSRRIQEVQPTE